MTTALLDEKEEKVGYLLPDVEETPDEMLYATTPNLIPPDVIINAINRDFILPASQNNGTLVLLQGDRKRGKYYANLVTRNKIPGLVLANTLTESNLKQLEEVRKKRNGETVPEWITEAWKHKKADGEESEVKTKKKK